METKTVVVASLVIAGAIIAYKLYQKNQKEKLVVNVNTKENEEMAEFAGGGRKGGGNMQPMRPNGRVQPIYTKRHK